MKRRFKGENSGFTLIEVILSMAILAVISLPLLKYFTDSIRYSRLMEQKQMATVAAQEMMEELKAEEALIGKKINADGTETPYTVPYLLDEGFTEVSGTNTLNTTGSEGRGSITMTKTEGNHDIVVSLNTASGANTVERPVVYSIDDRQDVLAVERDQYNEAIIYFMAVNSAYITEQSSKVPVGAPGATPAPGLVALTKEEIEQKTTREIHISVNLDAGFYLVSGYYEYSCAGIEGAGTVSTFTSSPLLDVKSQELRSIYLLYDIMHMEAASSPITNKTPKADTLVLENNTSIFPDLVIVAQNVDETELSTYEFQINCDKDKALDHTTIRTNLNTSNIENSYSMPGSADKVKNLSENGYPVRIINLTVSVYPAGGYDEDPAACEEPYTVFTSTKGE